MQGRAKTLWGSLNSVFGTIMRMASNLITLRSRSIWHLVDSIATAIFQSYGITRGRPLTNPRPRCGKGHTG